jgi:hypothetical protein
MASVRPVEHHIRAGQLRFVRSVVTRENVNDLLRPEDDTREINLMSIDIDRNDYWVWAALDVLSPRVVVIEYNATWPPPVCVAVEYAATQG